MAEMRRAATSPRHFPWASWQRVLGRLVEEWSNDRLGLVAAGLAFYGIVSLFPAFIALVSIYGLVADPADVVEQLAELSRMLPESAHEILAGQLYSLVGSSSQALGLGLIGSILFALWSGSTGVSWLLEGINAAYDKTESRGFLQLRIVALNFLLGSIVFGGLLLTLTAGINFWIESQHPNYWISIVLRTTRWFILGGAVMMGLQLLYRYGPCRKRASLRGPSAGALLATGLWLAITLAFAYYTSRFGSYNETYGALGGGVVLLMWLYLTNVAILLGAELNAVLEKLAAEENPYLMTRRPDEDR